MAEIRWTESQSSALVARGCNLVVSAAAGSGKTAVLTERIVRLLAENKVNAANLAVVTFTKAAAAELEQKLYEKLSERVACEPENSLLSKQLFRLSRAQISTIHSFCFSLIRQYKKELGLQEKIRIADPKESALLLRRAAEEGLEEFLSCKDPETLSLREGLLRLFGKAGSDNGILEEMLNLHKTVSSYPGGLSHLREKWKVAAAEAEQLASDAIPFAQTKGGEHFCAECIHLLEEVLAVLDAVAVTLEEGIVVSSRYLPFFAAKADALRVAKTLLEQGLTFKAAGVLQDALSEKMPSIPKCPEEEHLKDGCGNIYKKEVKEPLLALAKNFLSRPAPTLSKETAEAVAIADEYLILAETIEEKYRLTKEKRGVLDYNDLEQFTLRLVAKKDENGTYQKTPVARAVSETFDAVFVDEYQDTNRVQDLIFQSVTKKDNFFIVGDPKQSIYRFRGAEPAIFTEYKNKTPLYPQKNGEMQKILLSENFRCDNGVIDLVNRLFRVLMDETLPDSLYGENDRLKFSKKPEKDLRLAPELVIVDPKAPMEEIEGASEEKLSENRETIYIANRIQSLLAGEEGQKFEPGDIAVICRAKNQFAGLRDALKERGIPCRLSGDEARKEKPEYLFVTCLLQTIENPSRDIPLMATLSSPVFRFTDDDLLSIRKNKSHGSFYSALLRYAQKDLPSGGAAKDFLETLESLREMSRTLPLSSLIYGIYRRFSLEEIFSEGGKPSLRDFFLSSSAAAEACGFRALSSYLNYLESDEEDDEQGDGKNGVSIMTIHKSKGLEFPVVFVSFLGKYYHEDSKKNPRAISRKRGLSLALIKAEGRAKYNTVSQLATLWEGRREDREEEKRILYVAMTRARNKLILTGCPQSLKTLKQGVFAFSSKPFSPLLIRCLMGRMASPLETILFSLREDEALRDWLNSEEDREAKGLSLRFVKTLPLAERTEETEKEIAPLFTREEIEPWLSFEYEEKELETLPKKLSVSEILRQHREEEEPDFYPTRLMDFSRGILTHNAAQIGTATHQVMQFISFENAKADPESELQRLVQRGFLTAEEMALVDREGIRGFFASELFSQMAASPDVQHERRFNVLLPANSILNREGEVLVQGVVDAWFENPDGTLTLVDFKTDRVKDPTGEDILLSRHGEQLRLYRLAVKEITGKEVSRLVLYSFALGREVEVPLTK